MGSSSGDELAQWDAQGSNGQEKIFVAVRLRPLNDRETSRNDVSDWECINNNTVIFKNSIAERSMFPTAYTFGKHIVRPSFAIISSSLIQCMVIWVYFCSILL